MKRLIGAALLSAAMASGALAVSGEVMTTTWTKANSPYHVTGTITVPAGNTLTVEPGVDVVFDSTAHILVYGTLNAVGTAADSIRFLRGDVTEWRGIRVYAPDDDTRPESLHLAYVRISGGHAYTSPDDPHHSVGGALYATAITTLIQHCVVSGNRADSEGGGMAFWRCGVTITDTEFSDNSSVQGGGGLSLGECNVTVDDTRYLRNLVGYIGTPAYSAGAAFRADLSQVLHRGCLFAENRSKERSAVADVSNHASARFENCTFYGNEALEYGSVLYSYDSATSIFHNCIIWGNPGDDLYMTDTDYTEVTWSLIDQAWPGSNNITSGDPLFVDAAGGDFRLQTGSPCIDAGDPTSTLDPDGTRADIGAYYHAQEPGPSEPGSRGTVLTTTWTKANSPYHVTGTITVPEGNTLTIEPGVDVVFDSTAHMLVYGTLNAVGTAADSIRFLRGDVTEWRGLRVYGPDEGVTRPERLNLRYVRISGAHSYSDPDNLWLHNGAGLAAMRLTASVEHCVISGNRADGDGGGMVFGECDVTIRNTTIRDNACVYAGGGVVFGECNATVEDSRYLRNRAGYVGAPSYNAGAAVKVNKSDLLHRGCLFVGNWSNQRSGVVDAYVYAIARFESCTFYGNQALGYGSIIYAHDHSSAYFHNCIIWGNPGEDHYMTDSDYIEVTWSLHDDTWSGVTGANNIVSGDPLFVNAAGGDFRLQPGSPCIDAGDPSSPKDLDGTRIDMGAFGTATPVAAGISLPKLYAAPGTTMLLDIRAGLGETEAADLVFTIDCERFTPNADFVRSHPFESQSGAIADWSVRGDTLTVALVGQSPVNVSGSLVVLAFDVVGGSALADIPVAWVPYPATNVAEEAVTLNDGLVRLVTTVPGDATGDGSITTADASEILKYVVRKVETIDITAADVTGNGYVSSYDARHVIMRVLDPEHPFPVETGLPRAAATDKVLLTWERSGSGWILRSSDAASIGSLHLVLGLADGGAASVEGAGGMRSEYVQSGKVLEVAAARFDGSGDDLLRVSGQSLAPEVRLVEANEGLLTVEVIRPVEPATLAQNMPNPFNPTTTITYNLAEAGAVRLLIFNASGQLVRTLADGTVSSGEHSVAWDGRDFAGRQLGSGVYIYRLDAAGTTLVRRMTFIR